MKPSLIGLAAIGTTNAVCIGGGLALGWVADNHLGTAPVLTLVGLLVGVAAGVAATVAEVKTFLQP